MTITAPAPEAPSTTTATGQPVSGVGDAVRAYAGRVRGGETGSLPAVLGLVVLFAVFSVLRPTTFTNARNMANLLNQSSALTVIAMGLVFVLLLGEIDLSAGVTGGTGASVTAYVLTTEGQPWWLAVLAGLATGAFIGLIIGGLVAQLGIPSFVVTLAFFLGLQGVLLEIIGQGGTIAIRNSHLLKINNSPLPVWAGWLLFALLVGGYAAILIRRVLARRAQKLTHQPLSVVVAKVVVLAILLGGATAYLSGERSPNPTAKSIKGVPEVVALLVVLLLVLNTVLGRTSFGRHIYAVGGNTEAARRAGINVVGIKLGCFAISSAMAAIGGLLYASYDNSVSPTTGGNQTLLFAVGAAVIGGTSLFGGKGKMLDPILGGLVIATIINGMGLLNATSAVVFIVTGLVLLVAASVDAISRRRAAATGRV